MKRRPIESEGVSPLKTRYLLQSMVSKFERKVSLKQLRGASPFPFVPTPGDAGDESAEAFASVFTGAGFSAFWGAGFFSSDMIAID